MVVTPKKFGGPHWAWLPNLVTGGNLACGFLATLFCVEASNGGALSLFDTACFLVLIASLLDFLDGALAKLTNSASRYGMKMDTFADAVTFGLAPATLMGTTFLASPAFGPLLGWGIAGLYFVGAVWRLARFNVQEVGGFGFVGLPSPTAAIVIVSYYLVFKNAPLAEWQSAVIVALLGLLMICPLRYPAFKRMASREKYVVTAIVLSMYSLMGFLSFKMGASVAIPTVALYYFGTYTLVWGWWWVPVRHLWNPDAEKTSFIYKAS